MCGIMYVDEFTGVSQEQWDYLCERLQRRQDVSTPTEMYIDAAEEVVALKKRVLELEEAHSVNRMQAQVREFMVAVKQVEGIDDGPVIRHGNLRQRLVMEEANEFMTAVIQQDLPAAVDAICDLLYVTFGAAVAFGVNIEPMFNAVHEANMAKLGGAKDEHGKQLKPPGWKEPDMRQLLKAQGWTPAPGDE